MEQRWPLVSKSGIKIIESSEDLPGQGGDAGKLVNTRKQLARIVNDYRYIAPIMGSQAEGRALADIKLNPGYPSRLHYNAIHQIKTITRRVEASHKLLFR